MLHRPVAPHVVHDAAARDDETISALLDPLHVTERGVFALRRAVGDHFDDLPDAAQIRCSRDERFGARAEHGPWELVAVATGRGVRHGNRIGGRIRHGARP